MSLFKRLMVVSGIALGSFLGNGEMALAALPAISNAKMENPSAKTPPVLPLLGYGRFAPPKNLSSDALVFAQGIYPNQSMQIMPMIFLGFWGYPDYAGISDQDALSVFFFPATSSSENFNWIACARIEDFSPIWSTLALQNFKVRKFDGWALIGGNEKLLNNIADSEIAAKLLQLAQSPLKNDVEICFLESFIQLFSQSYERIVLRNLLQLGDLNGNIQGLSLINFGLNFARQLEDIDFTANLKGNQLDGQFALHARPGTDLAALFNAPIDGINSSDLARITPNNGISQSIVRYDPQQIGKILQHLTDAFFVYGQQNLTAISESQVYDFIDAIFQSYDGAMTTQVALDENNREVTRRLWSAQVTPEQLTQWVDFGYTQVAPVLLSALMIVPPDSEFIVETAVNRHAFSHRGINIIQATVAMEGVMMNDNGNPQSHANLPVENYFYCALPQMVGMTTSEIAMRQLIDDVMLGNLGHRSLQQMLPLSNGVAARMRFNPLQAVPLLKPGTVAGSLPDATPIEFRLKLGNGQAIFQFSVENRTIGQFWQALAAPNL